MAGRRCSAPAAGNTGAGHREAQAAGRKWQQVQMQQVRSATAHQPCIALATVENL